MNLRKELEKVRNIIDQELLKSLPKKISYADKIFDSMHYSIFSGGKRLRPILTLKTYELFKNDFKEAIPFAISIEMIHTYSLIHDDLPAMDNDDYRRGKLSNHKIYGENIAILCGDALLNYAFENMINYICKKQEEGTNITPYLKAMKKISEAAGVYGMIGGQTADILYQRNNIDKNILSYIHKNKTSALIEASILSGAYLGECDEDTLNALTEYSECLGLGYQIRDDILDRIGDFNKLGKKIGSDEVNNKATYLSIYTIDEAIEMTKILCRKSIEAIQKIKSKDVSFFKDLSQYLVYREN